MFLEYVEQITRGRHGHRFLRVAAALYFPRVAWFAVPGTVGTGGTARRENGKTRAELIAENREAPAF